MDLSCPEKRLTIEKLKKVPEPLQVYFVVDEGDILAGSLLYTELCKADEQEIFNDKHKGIFERRKQQNLLFETTKH